MKIAMANEGSMFAGDGIDLSWPTDGTRGVIEVDDDPTTWPPRLFDRMRNGVVVKVDDDTPLTDVLVAPGTPSDRTLTATLSNSLGEETGTQEVTITPGVVYEGGSPEALAILQENSPSFVRARSVSMEEVALVAESAEGEASPEADEGPTKAELQEKARELGLPIRGTKDEIAARIAEAEAAAEPEAEPEAEADAEAEAEAEEEPDGEAG